MNSESLSHAIGLIDDDILDEYDQRHIGREKTVRYKNRWKRRAAVAACAVFLVSAAAGIAWAASEQFRSVLADFLHLDVEQTHAVGVSDADEGIQITVVSTHSNEDVSVILLSFEKINGESFSYSWNPGDTTFSAAGKELAWTGSVLTRCSEDRKTLFCYITALFDNPPAGVTLQIHGLHRMESMTADDAESDMSLPGDWSVSFPLEEDENDTMKLENPDPQAYVCAFYKDLRIDSISLSSTCAVLDATVLKQYEISDEQRVKDLLSSYGAFLSGYYGVWLQLNFEDGSTSQYDMVYREGSADGAKLTAFFLEFVDMDTVESIQVGNLIVPLE